MADPYLSLKLHSQSGEPKKDKFEEAIEAQIEAYLDSIDFNEDSAENQLMTPEARRIRMREELRNSLEQGDLNQQILTAFMVLQKEGKEALQSEEYESMLAELFLIGEKVDKMNLDSPPIENFQTQFHISDATMGAILKVAISQFVASEFENCLAIFTLLTTLVPGHSEYWFRLGMAAQQGDKLDFAIRAYRNALDLNPKFIGTWLLLSDCYMLQGKQQEAIDAYKEAKNIEAQVTVDPDWKMLLDSIGNTLKANL